MTPQECQSITKAAIESGVLKLNIQPLTDEEVAQAVRERRLEYQRQKRARWKLSGLTVHGTPRKRTYEWLTGLTRKQILERKARKQRERRSLCRITH